MPPSVRRSSSSRLMSGQSHQERSSNSSSDSIRSSNDNNCTRKRCDSIVKNTQRCLSFTPPSPTALSPGKQQQKRRRSSRGHSSLVELAKEIVTNRKRVVLITGAGMSVASGIRPFRGKSNHHNEALWTQHIWTTATRETFRKDPLDWYNSFWFPCLSLPPTVKPNAAHRAVGWLLEQSSTGGAEALRIRMITQNVDGLLPPNPLHTIEAHGRIGLYKCLPDSDSDAESESDDDEDRPVHLGHRRKWKRIRESRSGSHESRNRRRCSGSNSKRSNRCQKCPYQYEKSVTIDQIEPSSVREKMRRGKGPLPETPKCPHCKKTLAPQALLFDEGYHSHDFYEFQKMEEWLADAEVVVFVGTSFAVRLPEVTLEHARAKKIPVYNINTHDMLSPTNILDAHNIKGPAEEILPLLAQEVAELQRDSNIRRTSTRLRQREMLA